MNFRKLLASLLMGTVALQPVRVAATEYRIPLREHVPSENVTPSSGVGSGVGVVDAGDNPVPAKLQVNPIIMVFDLTGGFRDIKQAVLSNIGAGPTSVSGLESNEDFTVTHNCPATLGAGSSCIVSVQPTTTATGGASYTLAAMAPTAKAPVLLNLSAIDNTRSGSGPVLLPRLQVVESTVDLGKLAVGESAAGSAILTNIGTADATLAGIASSKDFKTSTDCSTTLKVGASCTISTQFSSTVPRSHSLSMGLTASPGGAPTPVTFTAWVLEDPSHTPALAFDTKSLTFSDLPVGGSETKTATLSNFGTASALLAPLNSTPEFAVTSDCPDTLEPGASCTVAVTFAARVASTAPGATLIAQAQGEVHANLGLQGRVIGNQNPPKMADGVTFSMNSVDFGNVSVGTTPNMAVDMAYTEATPANISSMTIDRGPANFSQTNTCGSTLDPGTSCSITIAFKPTDPVAYPGSLKVSFSDGSYTAVALTGAGQSAVLSTSATNISVGTVVLPGVSKPLNVSLSNSGNVPLTGIAVLNNDSHLAINYGDCTNTIAPKKGCTMSLVYTPEADGTINSSFQVITENGGAKTFAVSGLAARMSVVPANLTFPETQIGTSAAIQSTLVSNEGSVSIPLDGISMTSGVQQFGQSNNCGKALAVGASCTVSVRYSPGRVGPNTGSVAIASNAALAGSLALAGTAVDYRLKPSVTSVVFADSHVGQSIVRTVTLTNQAPDSSTVTGVSIAAGASDYAQSNNCGDSIPVGGSCDVSVQFTPSALGAHTGSLVVTSSRGDTVLSLNGTAVEYPLEFSATTLSFPDTAVGRVSDALSVVVTNPSTNPATLDSISFSVGGSDYTQTNNCEKNLAGGASCTLNVQFKPSIQGARAGALTLSGSRGRYAVGLTGTATPALDAGTGGAGQDGFSHTAITFLDTEVGKSSAIRNVSFTNMGSAPLAVQSLGIVAGASDFNQSNNCGASLTPGEACTISVVFTPSELGARTGGIALLSDSGNFYFDLSGTGIGATGAWQTNRPTAFGSVPVGATSSLVQGFTNTGTLPIQNLSLTTTESTLTLSANSCGTPSAPVTLAGGASCAVTVTYAPTSTGSLVSAGVVASGKMVPVSALQTLSGDSPVSTFAFQATSTGDFGTKGVGSANTLTYTVENTGKVSDALNAAPSVAGPTFTITGGTCANGTSLVPGATCTVMVKALSTTGGTFKDLLKVTSKYGALAQLPLTAVYVQPVYALSGSAASNTTAPADFGQVVTSPSSPPTKYYYLRDDTNISQLATKLVSLSGDSSFTIVSLAVVDYNNASAVGCVVTATGTTTPCTTSYTSRAIRVAVKFNPTVTGTITANLHIEHNGAGGATDLQLSGTGATSVGEWTSDVTAAQPVPLTAADQDYGTHAASSTTDKSFTVKNTGKGKLALGFKLSGDTAGFKILSVQSVTPANAATTCGATVATDGLSTTTCTATDMTSPTGYTSIRVNVRFAPTSSGTQSVTLTPSTNNGTALPDALTLTGIGLFDANGVWSNTSVSVAPPSTANTTFSTVSSGGISSLYMYLLNTGTYGAESVGFVLAGDTSQFKLSNIAVAGNSLSNVAACPNGGVVASDGQTSTPCMAAAIGSGTAAKTNLRILIQFRPTAPGTYNMTLVPVSNNGTALPGGLDFRGTAR